MNNKKNKQMKQHIKFLLSMLCALILFTSCSDAFEVSPGEVLLIEDYLGDDKIDARSALFGVLSQMQDITGKYVVLGEARADLTHVTGVTVDEVRKISRLEIEEGNSYIDPIELFSMINNCNFALKGIDTVAYEKELLEDYASILRVRTWAQLQILINYGKLPYNEEPISSNEDFETENPLLSFDQGLDQLIENLIPYEGVDNVSKYANSLGFSIFKMIPDNDVLMGDIHLWRKNYVLSATYYKQFLDNNVSNGGNLYNLTSSYRISYASGSESAVVTTNWWDLFDDNVQGNEAINYVGYSDQYRQSNTSYKTITEQLIPSQLSVKNWANQWKVFEGVAFAQGDIRAQGSYDGIGDASSISKFQEEFFVWNRAAKIYLRYAEAINYAGHPVEALTIINGIFNNTSGVGDSTAPIFNNPVSYLNFDVDQYYVQNATDVITGGNLGIRGRVSLEVVDIPNAINKLDSINQVGAHILNENALELAFEGNRWEDLVRFARRDGDASIIADPIYEKFIEEGDAATADAVHAKLSDGETYWFLPLDIPSNFVEVVEE